MANHTANKFRTDLWKEDSIHSVDFYNQWFMESAPEAYRVARAGVVSRVILTLKGLDYLRACTAPPIAVDRLGRIIGDNQDLNQNIRKR